MLACLLAWYGRMRLGRCISTEESDVYVGCATDVLALMDARCSGRQSCAVRIPDPVLDEQLQHACPIHLAAYLETSYTCVNGNQHTCPTIPTDCQTFSVANANWQQR